MNTIVPKPTNFFILFILGYPDTALIPL